MTFFIENRSQITSVYITWYFFVSTFWKVYSTRNGLDDFTVCCLSFSLTLQYLVVQFHTYYDSEACTYRFNFFLWVHISGIIYTYIWVYNVHDDEYSAQDFSFYILKFRSMSRHFFHFNHHACCFWIHYIYYIFLSYTHYILASLP